MLTIRSHIAYTSVASRTPASPPRKRRTRTAATRMDERPTPVPSAPVPRGPERSTPVPDLPARDRPANDDNPDKLREVPLAVPFEGRFRERADKEGGGSADALAGIEGRTEGVAVLDSRSVLRFSVYLIRDPVTDEVVYVGQTSDFPKRRRAHLRFWRGDARPKRHVGISR